MNESNKNYVQNVFDDLKAEIDYILEHRIINKPQRHLLIKLGVFYLLERWEK